MAKAEGILTVPVIGQNYFEEATTGTKHLSSKDLINFRKKLLFSYHVQPSFVAKKMKDILIQPKKFPNYFKYGVKLIQNTFF